MGKNMIELNLSTVMIEVASGENAEMLERAKAEFLKNPEKYFKVNSYRVHNAGTLQMEDALPGTIVSLADNELELGVITERNQKTINVVLKGHRVVQAAASIFKASDAKFEDAATLTTTLENNWVEGDAGYIHSSGEVIPVVIGKMSGKKYRAHRVDQPGAYYSLTKEQMQKFFKTTK